MSFYDACPTCYGLNKTIIMEAVCKGIGKEQILPQMCICVVKVQYFKFKLLKNLKYESVTNVWHFLTIFYLTLYTASTENTRITPSNEDSKY